MQPPNGHCNLHPKARPWGAINIPMHIMVGDTLWRRAVAECPGRLRTLYFWACSKTLHRVPNHGKRPALQRWFQSWTRPRCTSFPLLFLSPMRTKFDIYVYRFLGRSQVISNPLCTVPSSPMTGKKRMGSLSARMIPWIRKEVEHMTSIRPMVVEESLITVDICWSSLCSNRSAVNRYMLLLKCSTYHTRRHVWPMDEESLPIGKGTKKDWGK